MGDKGGSSRHDKIGPRGRPVTVPKQILEAVDKIARNEKTSRTKIVQQLLAETLEARRKL